MVDYLTPNEANALLVSIDDSRDRAIITLFLNTGIFLSELIDLKLNSIDWDKKILKLNHNRKRSIPIKDAAFEALNKWRDDRIDTSPHLFVTARGEVQRLSARAVDKIIRKYARQAGIEKKVNAIILRNTFAVQLFSENTSRAKASAILGITDHGSINRYRQASRYLVSGKTLTQPSSQLGEAIFGREGEIEQIKLKLFNDRSVLLTGPIGIGKTHLLRHITKTLDIGPWTSDFRHRTLYISSPTPLRNMLTQICEKLNPDYKKQLNTRASIREIVDYITKASKTLDIGHLSRAQSRDRTLLIIDNLHNLKSSDIELFLTLLENFTVLGAAEKKSSKLKQIWWKFKQIELEPLSDQSAKELIKYLTQNLSISDYQLLETRIMTLSNKLPLAIVDMVHQISHQPVVTCDSVREIYHDAGVRYRDWTPIIVVLWGAVVIFRFIALGSHNFEGYVLAGFGMAIVMMLRFFLFKMR